MDKPGLKPYLLRALYEWCTDSGYTPHIVVKAGPNTRVPQQFVRDGEIVLNIAASAVTRLAMDNDFISFSARFGGVAEDVFVPVGSVTGLFAKETGEGMGFEAEDADHSASGNNPGDAGSDNPVVDPSGESKKGGLKIVK